MKLKTLVFNLVIAAAAVSVVPAQAKDGRDDYDAEKYSKYDWSDSSGYSLNVMPKQKQQNFKERRFQELKEQREAKKREEEARRAK